MSVDWDLLRSRASAARDAAYAPYSRFHVGAALLAEDGTVFVGANVENASYGLAICAERSAIASAVVHGHRRFSAIAIVAPGPRPASPCGMCRQVLAEFPPSFPVRSYTPEGVMLASDVQRLLPDAFGPGHLDGSEGR